MTSLDSFKTLRKLSVNEKQYNYYSLPTLEAAGLTGISQLPYTLKILLENLLRHEDNETVTQADIKAIADWLQTRQSDREISYRPARVLMQDFTGVPAVVDLGAMRDAIKKMGGNPERINPLSPVDLVIDHSIQVDAFGTHDALQINSQMEMQRNVERYAFLRWGQKAFANFRVVPPDTGICHQVNLEYLAKTIWQDGVTAYPDTLVGTDSHTTMINGLGVLGWGVGGIEAEAAMLGQPISMLIPEVVGVKLTGKLREGVTATDLVLTLTQLLRKHGVVGKFVEYYGKGLTDLPVADRATIANMAPEYGATCGFFPIDSSTLHYLRLTGRDENDIALVEAYAKAQGLWHEENHDPLFTTTLELDLTSVQPSLAGPKRPQDRVELSQLKSAFDKLLTENKRAQIDHAQLQHGDVVIAAITSCTNTSNPSVLMAAGLVAKKALEKGLQRKPWVKSSLAPGSQVVTQYLQASGLNKYLDDLGFDLVGYGCTTCIGNSGPLPDAVAKNITENDLLVSAVLSGNRNFEGRIHPQIKANWLASPPLVVVFALTGTVRIDLTQDAIGHDKNGHPVYLKDIWPSNAEIAAEVAKVTSKMFEEKYADVFAGSQKWQAIAAPAGETYSWQEDSTYIQHPPFFTDMQLTPDAIQPITSARILAVFGDSITTDHISPAGSIKPESPAGKYLQGKGVAIKDFNSYGARRGNHEVMMRGTFANIRIKNEMMDGMEGGMTKHYPDGKVMSIYDAAMCYQQENIPLIVIAGKEYGTGSSRDWAAKGPKLQGVRAVIAESFERIHRSNLVGMGILPLQFMDGENRQGLKLNGTEVIDILNLNDEMKPAGDIQIAIKRADGSITHTTVKSRIDTQNEVEYYRHGGILQYVLRKMV
jgi:aconitate hydratase A / 2-methylisocitrate dehydratase